MPAKDVEYGAAGKYTELEPRDTPGVHLDLGRRRQATLIELDFEETDGITTVRFTHSGLWDDESVRAHEDGWGKCFDNLQRTLQAARLGDSPRSPPRRRRRSRRRPPT